MKLNARIAIYCDLPVEIPDDYNLNDDDTLDVVIDQIFEEAPILYDLKTKTRIEAWDCEVFSIYNEDNNKCCWCAE